MKLKDIKLNKDNPRFIKDHEFEKLKESISEFPKMMELRPIVVDDNNVILGGNMRYRALQELGYKDIPDSWVRKASELTEEEKKRFIIADNVSHEQWDWDILANDWGNVQLSEWGLFIPEYYNTEIDDVPDVNIKGEIKDTTDYIVISFDNKDQRDEFKNALKMDSHTKVLKYNEFIVHYEPRKQ